MKADDLFRQIQGQDVSAKQRWAEQVLQEEARRQDLQNQYGKIAFWNPPFWFWLILAAFWGLLFWVLS